MSKSVLAGLLLCLCAITARAAESWIEIADAWVREAPPGATVLAGYLRVTNRSDAGLDIVAIHSEAFERIELHRTVIEDGLARMLPVERLEIAAGESVALAPGGMHLMLFSPVRPLREDDRVAFSLELADGRSHRFEALVRRESGDDAHRHHHHHQH